MKQAVVIFLVIFLSGVSYLAFRTGDVPTDPSSEPKEHSVKAPSLELKVANPGREKVVRKKRISEAKVSKPIPNKKVDYTYSAVLEVTEKGIRAPVTVTEDGPVVMGDILIGHELSNPPQDGDQAELPKAKYWSGREVPYYLDSEIKKDKNLVKHFNDAVEEMNRMTSVRWIERSDQEDYVKVSVGKEHCLSALGKVGGEQPMLLSGGCEKGEILHEMMHTLGFFHEHAKPDRDEFLIVYWDNIDQKYWPQFKIVPPEVWPSVDIEFDLKSIMLYSPTSFAKNERFATISTLDGKLYEAQRDELSPLDIEKVNLLYQDF